MDEVTIRDAFKPISKAINENSTLTEAIMYTGFTGKIIINVEPNKYKIKDIKFEYTYKSYD